MQTKTIFVIYDGQLIGSLNVSDTVRPEAKEVISQLKGLGVKNTVMLTGDRQQPAENVKNELGLSECHAELLPAQKLELFKGLKSKSKGACFVGDGINDAPALKKANVGVAMGGIGSDIAVDAADIVLVDDDVKELPHLIALSKRMLTTIKVNMSFSMILNFIAIILAMLGILNPVFGALVHNAGSVLVIINSAFLLKWKRRAA